MAIAGLATALRELADVRRLELDPAHPDGQAVAIAVEAYLESRNAFKVYAQDVSADEQA